MKRIYIVGKSQFSNEEESLYKKNSLSEFDTFIAKQKAELVYISVEEIERIQCEDEVIIFKNIPLLEAVNHANRNTLSRSYRGIYIDAENVEGFNKLTKTYRDASYIPFDFIVYGSNYIEIKSIVSIELPKYRFKSEAQDMEITDYSSTTLWKIKSRVIAKNTIKCVIIHPNNIHGWNTRQVVKDAQYYIHKINEIIMKLKDVELSLMIDSSRYISIPEMAIFNKLNIKPKLVNPMGIEETLCSCDLILFIPSAYKCHLSYGYIMNRLASKYKCEILTIAEEINRNEVRQENTKLSLMDETKQVVEWVKEKVSIKRETELKILALEGKLEHNKRHENQLAIFISNEINKESRPLDRIAKRENLILVDWLMRRVPQNDIWIMSDQMDFLSISRRLYEKIKQFSMCEKIQKNRLDEDSLLIEIEKLSEKALESLRRVVSLREGLSNLNRDKANNIEKLLYDNNREVIKDVLKEICPNYCMIADVEEFLIDKTMWLS